MNITPLAYDSKPKSLKIDRFTKSNPVFQAVTWPGLEGIGWVCYGLLAMGSLSFLPANVVGGHGGHGFSMLSYFSRLIRFACLFFNVLSGLVNGYDICITTGILDFMDRDLMLCHDVALSTCFSKDCVVHFDFTFLYFFNIFVLPSNNARETPLHAP